MPRKSSTNTRVLSARINNIKKETSPVISVTPIRTNPPAKALSTDRWRTQSARIVLGSAGALFLTTGMVVKALGLDTLSGDRQQMKILGVKVWNTTGAATSTGYLNVSTGTILTISSVAQTGEDFGNATSSPGMKFNIPDTLANSIAMDPTSSATICSATGQPVGIASTAIQTFCFDVTVMFRL